MAQALGEAGAETMLKVTIDAGLEIKVTTTSRLSHAAFWTCTFL
jgi:hypothetical protein